MDTEDLTAIVENMIAIARHRGKDLPSEAIEYFTLAARMHMGLPIPSVAGIQALTAQDMECVGATIPDEVELAREAACAGSDGRTADLRKRILESSAVFLFSKVPGARSDYFLLAQQGFQDGFLEQHKSGLVCQMPSDLHYLKVETVAYLDDGGLLVPHETFNNILIRSDMAVGDVVKGGALTPVFFLKYQCRTGQRDGWKRPYDASWYVATTEELGREIIQNIRDNPDEAFHLFNGMLGIDMSRPAEKIFFDLDSEQRPYTADRRGTIYIVDGKRIRIKNSSRSVDFKQIRDGAEIINYSPGSDF